MNIDELLSKGGGKPRRRTRSLDNLGLDEAPVVYELSHAEFSQVRSDESVIISSNKNAVELLKAELMVARDKEDYTAREDIERKLQTQQECFQSEFDKHQAYYALYSMTECERKPNPDEVERFLAIYSADVVAEIYRALVSFSNYDRSLEELKKP